MKEEEGGFRSITGGLPAGDLDFDWPQFKDRSLSLLATIYLAELPGIHDWLPAEGFFSSSSILKASPGEMMLRNLKEGE